NDAVAFALAVGDDAKLDLGAFLERLARDIELGERGDQDAGLAVVDDVGEVASGQIRVDAGEIETGPLAGAARLEVAAVVLHVDRIVIEPLEAATTKQMRQAVGARVELRVADGLAGIGHDEGRLMRAQMN